MSIPAFPCWDVAQLAASTSQPWNRRKQYVRVEQGQDQVARSLGSDGTFLGLTYTTGPLRIYWLLDKRSSLGGLLPKLARQHDYGPRYHDCNTTLLP
jgi:hypothetical protein